MTALEWTEVAVPPGFQGRAFEHLTRPLRALVAIENGRVHMSVSHRERIPTWEELGIARDALLPADMHFCIPHPPRRFWINYNRRVLHLHELRDAELIEQFEWEGEEARRHGANIPDSGE